MWIQILQAFIALGAIATLLTVLYRTYFSPAAKAKRQALADGQKANEKQDISGITSAYNRLNRKLILVIATILLFAGGCGSNVIVTPITGLDVIPLAAGEQIVWFDIKTGEKHTGAPVKGYFISQSYNDTVMQVKGL